MYVDEVGNSDLESSDNPNHRFLSLTGVVLDLEHVASRVHPEMEALKGAFFGSHPDEPVIFHRKEMVNAKHPFEALADRSIQREFDLRLLNLLKTWDYTVITVCLDKKAHKENYSTWRYDPYHYCLAVLLERLVFFLRRRRAQGDVMAESRGGKEDMRLKRSFERLFEQGTPYVEDAQFRDALTSRQLKVRPKQMNVAGLQLADLIAHPSRNEILHDRGLLDKEIAPFGARVVEILQQKYDRMGPRLFGKKFI